MWELTDEVQHGQLDKAIRFLQDNLNNKAFARTPEFIELQKSVVHEYHPHG